MGEGWEEFVGNLPDELGGGEWIELPENGWGALVAYAAGPGCVRPHDAPLAQRTVSVHCTARDGRSSHFVEPMSEADLQTIHEGIEAFLADAGVPVPPYFWWEVRLRRGVTLKLLEEAIDQAYRAEGYAPSDGRTEARREAEIMRRVVPSLVAERVGPAQDGVRR